MANCVRCGRKLPGLTFGKKICEWCVRHEAAQRGELAEDAPQPVIAAPWVRRHESTITLTHLLFGANVAVFLAMIVATVMNGGSPTSDFSFPLSAHFGANYGPLTLSGEWWRLFTYMFVHADIWHIAFNMWCLWDLGTLCESLYGKWTFGAIYVITGIAGGVASLASHPFVFSVGASGAIFGLCGALIASFYLGEFGVPRSAIQANLKSLLFFAGFNLLFGISAIGDLFGIRVDNAAHIGGLVSGLIIGALIAVIAPMQDNPLRRVTAIAAVALLVAAAALGVSRWRGTPLRMGHALASISQNQPDRAMAQLQAIVRQKPNFMQGHFLLAREYFNAGKYSQAEGEFRRVLELAPGNTTAQFDLGLTYLNQNRLGDAKAAFNEILSKNSGDAEAHYGLGLVLAAENNHQDAIAQFQSAIQSGAQFSGMYYEMGQSYAKLGKYDTAIKAYLDEKEKNGDDADLEDSLAAAYQAKGMTNEARDAKSRATQLKNNQPAK